jgi:hypothetical protein
VTCAPDVPPTLLSARTGRTQPRDGQRGRPGPDARPAQVVDQRDGAWASALASRPALIAQHRWVILAPNALDTAHLPPQAVLAGDQGQVRGERGCRFLTDPQLLAAARYLKQPARIMALVLVMTLCLLVDAAVDYRLRHARKDHEATCPDQQGQRSHHPTARGGVQGFVGMHLRGQAGQWPILLNLTADQQHWLRLLGQPSRWLYDVKYS